MEQDSVHTLAYRVYFAYDLAALSWARTNRSFARSSLADLETIGEEVADRVGEDGPEFWWPDDRSWVVTTDGDLLSTYAGCSAEIAERILRDAELEALSVTTQTRVDWYADRSE